MVGIFSALKYNRWHAVLLSSGGQGSREGEADLMQPEIAA